MQDDLPVGINNVKLHTLTDSNDIKQYIKMKNHRKQVINVFNMFKTCLLIYCIF